MSVSKYEFEIRTCNCKIGSICCYIQFELYIVMRHVTCFSILQLSHKFVGTTSLIRRYPFRQWSTRVGSRCLPRMAPAGEQSPCVCRASGEAGHESFKWCREVYLRDAERLEGPVFRVKGWTSLRALPCSDCCESSGTGRESDSGRNGWELRETGQP